MAINAFGLGMGRQVPERLRPVVCDSSRQGIKAAGQRPIRMHTVTALAEKAAIAVFLRRQNCTPSLGVAFNELRRRDANMPCKTQDFVGADSDRLVPATPIAGVTDV